MGHYSSYIMEAEGGGGGGPEIRVLREWIYTKVGPEIRVMREWIYTKVGPARD